MTGYAQNVNIVGNEANVVGKDTNTPICNREGQTEGTEETEKHSVLDWEV